MDWDSRKGRLIERGAIVVASLVLSIGAIALLSGYFAGNDEAGVRGGSIGPGAAYKDLGDAYLPPGRLQPPYNSDPPTSGAHVPEAVTSDQRPLDDNQLLQALSLGNVVIMYGTRAPPAGLKTLAARLSATFTPALAATGQAVILAQRPGTTGLIALAWTHMLRVDSPNDPLLHAFVQFWLGKGAPQAASRRSLPAS
ncbi:MAG TPA: DUF3105 domain-containing protein [Solirubrobacteraceae bacterium]|nr:DUF3105 domain-containing protein [Solirubrobacteraceae bacterium]